MQGGGRQGESGGGEQNSTFFSLSPLLLLGHPTSTQSNRCFDPQKSGRNSPMVINQAPNKKQVRQTFLDGKGGCGERELL